MINENLISLRNLRDSPSRIGPSPKGPAKNCFNLTPKGCQMASCWRFCFALENPTFTVTNRSTAGLTRIELARCFVEAAKLSENRVRKIGNWALVLGAHHTTNIEGTQLMPE